jgi:hypothetical protein
MKHSLFCLFAFLVTLLSVCQSSLISNLAAQPGEILSQDE